MKPFLADARRKQKQEAAGNCKPCQLREWFKGSPHGVSSANTTATVISTAMTI
jgi:hypothetical protein